MTAFGIIAGVLQLTVPSYAFRLVRRFGAQRVGWFVVTSFASLALLHVLMPLNLFRATVSPEFSMHAVLALGSIFLVIGMGHLETLCTERDNSLRAEQKLRAESEQHWQGETEHLTKSQMRLTGEVEVLKQREQVLALSVAQYEFLFRANPQPMAILDRRSGQFVLMNDAAAHKLGIAPENGASSSLHQFLTAEHAEQFNAQLQETCGSVRQFGAWPLLASDERTLTMELSGIDFDFNEVPARLLVFNDITLQQQREDQRTQTEKLAAITEVSAALGKAFGSTLGQIESNAASLASGISEPSSAQNAKQISAAAARGLHLSRQLLAVGGCHPLEAQPLDMNAFLRNLNPMLARMVGDRVILQNAFGSYVATVAADARLLEHLFMTLVLNARDAIPGKGTITVSTSAVRVEANPFANTPGGEFVRISVRDTGPGLKPEVQARLFEPFVSSDPEGLGLGLASCAGIVRQHGGWMECSSEEQGGTEFRIFLPCATVMEPSPQETRVTPKNDATILLVEPDDRTRGTTRTALNWQGYRVIEADTSALALLFWERQSSQIDLVIASIQLEEGMTGTDLAAQLQHDKPELEVIYLSEERPETHPEIDGASIIQKPFTREKLLEVVGRATKNKLPN